MSNGVTVGNVEAGVVAEDGVVNVSCTVTSTVFNLPMPSTGGPWKYAEIAVGTADEIVAAVVCPQSAAAGSNPAIGSATDGNATWGKGYARLGVSVSLTPMRPLTSSDEIRMVSVASAAVIVSIFKE